MHGCRIYGTRDVPPGALDGESVAVVGCGHLGHAAAMNLRDSGVKVRVGNRADEYADRARRDGFEVVPIAEAARDSIVWVLLPDEVMPEVFRAEIAPELRSGSAVVFGSGYSLAFGHVRPPDLVDVLLVAPRMAGVSARARYQAGEGFWACVGVEADRSGRARQRMLGLAHAVGARSGCVETSAAMEATLDLFIEQTVGPLLGTAIMVAFEVGREAGLAPEALALELYMSGEMEMVFRRFREAGFFPAAVDHGPTALFGGITRTLDIDRAEMAERFRGILADIRSGAFADRFRDEAASGYPMLAVAQAVIDGGSPLSEAEEPLRRPPGPEGPGAEAAPESP